MKIQDLKPNEVIHCKTKEEAVRICGMMHDAGLEWCSGKSYEILTNFDEQTGNVCYLPAYGECCDLDWYIKEGYTIYPSKLFQDSSDSSDEITEEGLRDRGFEKGNNASFFMKWDNGIRLVWFSGITQVRFVSNHIAIPNCHTLTDIDHLIRLLGI